MCDAATGVMWRRSRYAEGVSYGCSGLNATADNFNTTTSAEGEQSVEESITVRAMGIMRIVSGAIELAAAFLMLRLARVETAVQINAALGLVGPAIFISVTALGIAGLSDKISVTKLLMIAAGVVLIFLGGRK